MYIYDTYIYKFSHNNNGENNSDKNNFNTQNNEILFNSSSVPLRQHL